MKHLLTVVVVSLSLGLPLRAEPEIFTNVYVVPPTFLTPDAAPTRATPVKSVLERAGITFGEGASALYNAATSQLIVRNTQDQMELVDFYLKSIVQKVEKQIYITVREVRFRGELAEAVKSRKSKSATAGTEVDEWVARLFDFPETETGKRGNVYHFDSETSFQAEMARPPKPIENARDARRIAMTGAFTDPQFQIVIRELSQVGGVEIESPPALVVRSGQPAMTRREGRRYGVIPVLGADEFTIDLALFLPEDGKALIAEGTPFEPTTKVTIWDGQTVAVAEKNVDGENCLVFVTAQLLDSAGMPINPAAPPEAAVEPDAKAAAKTE